MKNFRFFIPLTLILITFLTYFNILPNQLFYDDEELIYQNAYVQDLKYLPKYFTENMIAGAGKLSNMYRPILLTSFAVDWIAWGNNPIGYHLTSILLHGLNSILIFILINILFGDKIIAFLVSILFIIHPVQTETIAYASGRTDPLFSFFTLSSLLLSLAFWNSKKQRLLRLLGAVILFILALLSKETAIILPLLTILVVYASHSRESGNLLNRSWIKSMFFFVPFFLIDIIYIILRLTVLNFANTLNFYQSNNIYSQNLAVRLFTFTRVFFEYIKIILFPNDLIFARNIDPITSPFNIWVIMFLLIVISIIVFLIKNKTRNRFALFSFFWFFITLLPVSGIIPINSVIAEHYLYLTSVSFFLLFAYLCHLLWKKYHSSSYQPLLIFSLVFVFISLFSRTFLRNFDWKDPITFYSKSLAQSPWHVPMRHNLAMAYAQQGKFDIAVKEYQILIRQSDVYPQTHHNLANVYKTIGRYQEAEAEYLKALQMDQKFFFSLYGLADLYKITGEKEKLEEITQKLKLLQK